MRLGWFAAAGTIGLSTVGRVYGSAEPMVHSSSTVTLGPRDRARNQRSRGHSPALVTSSREPTSGRSRLYVAIPVLMGVPPALVGRPLFPGSGTADNLTQNYPLRVLSGELLRHGRAAAVGPVHLERNAAARRMERGSPLPRHVALRRPACQLGVDDQRRFSVDGLRAPGCTCSCAVSVAPRSRPYWAP